MFAKKKLPLLAALTFIVCMATLPGMSYAAATTVAPDASSPLKLIQSGTDKALQILREAHTGSAPTVRARRPEILEIVDAYFDFSEMARRSLGRAWKDQTPEKQQEFVPLFKDLIFNTYVDRVEGYTGSDEKVVYDQEQIEGSYALVKTRVLGFKNADVQVDYRLKKQTDGWRVYDVIVEGISLVDNYRGQFSSILASESFDSLLNRLRTKSLGGGK